MSDFECKKSFWLSVGVLFVNPLIIKISPGFPLAISFRSSTVWKEQTIFSSNSEMRKEYIDLLSWLMNFFEIVRSFHHFRSRVSSVFSLNKQVENLLLDGKRKSPLLFFHREYLHLFHLVLKEQDEELLNYFETFSILFFHWCNWHFKKEIIDFMLFDL